MSSLPTVSILLPVRNAGAHLYEAMASLVSQTFDALEVVCVDDGSTDDTPDLLADWADRDGRIRVLRQGPLGIVAALERARSSARGRLLARMDGDDRASPTRIARQVALLESEPDLAGCGCHVRYFPAESVRDGARRYEAWLNALSGPDDIAASIFVECPLAHPTLMLRSDVFDAVGGYRDGPWPEDYDLVLRLWSAGHRLGVVPDVLHEWREHPDRLSRVDPRYSLESFRACKLHFLQRTLLERPRPVVVWGAGPVGKGWSRALRDVGVEVVAFVDVDPRKVGQSIHGAPVFEGSSFPRDALDRLLGPGAPSALHLAAVGQAGARERIVSLLSGAGLGVLEDFVAVA